MKLHTQRLVQTDSSKLGSAIVHKLVSAAVSGEAGHVHDVPNLPLDHLWQERLQGPEMSENIDVKCSDNFGVRCIEKCSPRDDTGYSMRLGVCLFWFVGSLFTVVYQNSNMTNIRFCLLGIVVDGVSLNICVSI